MLLLEPSPAQLQQGLRHPAPQMQQLQLGVQQDSDHLHGSNHSRTISRLVVDALATSISNLLNTTPLPAINHSANLGHTYPPLAQQLHVPTSAHTDG